MPNSPHRLLLCAVALIFTRDPLLSNDINVASEPSRVIQSPEKVFAEAHQAMADSLMETLNPRGGLDSADRERTLDEWENLNTAALLDLQQKAVAVSNARVAVPLPMISTVDIPADASAGLEELLVQNANLYNQSAQVWNQNLASTPQVQEKAMEASQKQNGPALAAQQQLARQVAAESIPPVIQIPNEPVIPHGASPELTAFLQERHILMEAQLEVMNASRLAAPAEREKAMTGWQKQNADRLQEISQQAADLGKE